MDVNTAIANLEKACPRMVLVFSEEWQTLKATVLAQLSHNTGSPKLLAIVDYAINALLRDDYNACSEFLNNLRKQLRAGA